MPAQNYFVYMLTNADRHTVLYIGVTNDLERRASEHSLGWGSGFAREKQLKRWSRAKKDALIARSNPEWRNLFSQMYALQSTGGAS